MDNKKYYVIKNKNLAITVSYLLNKSFFTFDDRFNLGKKVYSFEDTQQFRDILTLIKSLRTNK